MVELKTIRRVMVYADAALKPILIEHFLELGARGYSETDCRGKGKHDVMGDPLTGLSLVRIEVIVKPEVGEKIMGSRSQGGIAGIRRL
jgi:hypothetical protein